MKTLALAAVAAAAFSAPAFASDQLAAQLGLDAGSYSVAELIEIRAALESEERTQSDFYINERSSVVSTQSVGITAGHSQLAAQLGLDPSAYTVSELVQIRAALENDKRTFADFYISR
ncbi:hypothetical protein AADZ90_015200 [Aestuariibius sp. 2305UL40-4]|uniref:hypothetical protein n=1 Tax=Aestuariibius violaceus TaxID=3234132 RepID=UPI00345E0C75